MNPVREVQVGGRVRQSFTLETHLVFRFSIGAGLQEGLHCGEMLLLARPMQGSFFLGITYLDLGLEIRKQPHQILATLLGRDQQRSLPACSAWRPGVTFARTHSCLPCDAHTASRGGAIVVGSCAAVERYQFFPDK
jgi:hypothetical protein